MSDPYLWTSKPASRSTIGPTCDRCQVVHSTAEIIAVGKFEPGGPHGYRLVSDDSLHASRADAEAYRCRKNPPPAGGVA